MEYRKLLGLKEGITAIIGSGGKTTLLHRLGEECSHKGKKVIVTTTTHIHPPAHIPCTDGTEAKNLLVHHNIVCVGTPSREGKLTAGVLPMEELSALADYVLVEADGSRGLPIKAHAPYEPVIPIETRRTILVVGASGLGKRISEAVHRYELFCTITGEKPENLVTPEAVAKGILAEHLSDVVFINQLDTNREEAERLRRLLTIPSLKGALKGDCPCEL